MIDYCIVYYLVLYVIKKMISVQIDNKINNPLQHQSLTEALLPWRNIFTEEAQFYAIHRLTNNQF